MSDFKDSFMHKLITLYQTLDKSEKTALRRWVHSPVHNMHEQVTALFDYLLDKRELTEKILDKKKIYNVICKNENETYNDLRLRHLFSLALDVLEQFVRFQCVKDGHKNEKIALAKAYRQRKKPQQAQNALEQAADLHAKEPYRDANHYFEGYQIECERFELLGTTQRTEANNLLEINRNLTIFFIIQSLKYAIIQRSHENLRQGKQPLLMLDAVLQELQQNDYSQYPEVWLYYHAYCALEQPQEELHFQYLKTAFAQTAPALPPDEHKRIYRIALNYCIKRLNTGDTEYIREAFEWYQRGLQQELLLDEGNLSRFTYKNIVALGCRLGEYEWTRNFITQYASWVEESSRNAYLHYNTARLHFAQQQYKEAMRLLVQIEYDDLFMNIDAKVMLLKMYYETDEDEALEALLKSFKTFVQRKTLMSYHKENYLNIIKFTQKIRKLRPRDQKTRSQLRHDIEQTRPLTEKDWLLGLL